jgi:hypothetical protein
MIIVVPMTMTVVVLSEDVASDVCASIVQQATIARIQTKKNLNIISNKSDGRDCKGLQRSSFSKENFHRTVHEPRIKARFSFLGV